MATINLSGRLSAIATNGSTITKSGSRYIVTGGISMLNGGVIDVPVLADFIEFDGITNANAVGTIGLIDSPVAGDFFPIDVELTASGSYSYGSDPMRTRGNITVNTYNCTIRFTGNNNSSVFMTWPGAVAQTGVKWNAKNTNVIAGTAGAYLSAQAFPAGGGTLENVNFLGMVKIFFTSSPVSASNVVNVRTTNTADPAAGFTGDTATYELIGGSSDYISYQRTCTTTYTDFKVTKQLRAVNTDAGQKWAIFKRRFTSNIIGGSGLKFWAFDKDKTNVVNGTLDILGVLPVTKVEWQRFGSTSGNFNKTAAQINTDAVNLKAPFAVRIYGYGKLPLDYSHTPDITVDEIRTAYTPAGISATDGYAYLAKADVAAYTTIANADQVYCAFANWLDGNGNTYSPEKFSFPDGGDFKDWALVFDSAASDVLTPNVATKTLTAKTTKLAGGTKITTIKSTAGITTNVALENIGVIGNVSQATPTNMTGVNITGNLTYNVATNTTITLTNCTISGTVSNTGAGTVTVNLAGNSSIGTTGTRVVVKNTKTFSFSVADESGNAITNYEYRIYEKSGTQGTIGDVELAGEEVRTSSTGSYAYSYVADKAIVLQVIKAGYVEGLAETTLGNADQSVTLKIQTERNI